jgi:hypothetical protein
MQSGMDYRINMMRTSVSFIFLFTLVQAMAGCSKGSSNAVVPVPPVDTVITEKPLVNLPSSWQMMKTYMNGFPKGIEVYRNTTPFNGKSLHAWCVVIDPKNVSIEFKPVLASVNTKPSVLFSNEPGNPLVAINGGFFGTNVSYSLVHYAGDTKAKNIASLSRPLNGVSATYYPTRGAFGLDLDSNPAITWIYHVGNVIYSYPDPSPNELNKAPQPRPDQYFPANGKSWNAIHAIGGSPVLLKNGAIRITDKEELIDINNTSSRARSAVGYNSTGKVFLLAVEGNNAQGGAGLSLNELAQLMMEMGCTDALNLDGGGSTSMTVNGMLTVKPSDASGERSVMSAIIIKKK